MLAFIGREAGDRWKDWKDSLHYVDYAVAASVAIAIVFLVVRARRRSRSEPESRQGDSAATETI
jgi:hypothetical protein